MNYQQILYLKQHQNNGLSKEIKTSVFHTITDSRHNTFSTITTPGDAIKRNEKVTTTTS